jgi:dTMP kinase
LRGRFITLEGIDGAGKSTHHQWLVEYLRERGKEVVCTREPGGTALGEQLRTLLLNEPMHRETEVLLMFAARREHIAEVIEPALQRGVWVISDRFTDASFAYQGGGRGVPLSKLGILEAWVQEGLTPDLTLLFDLAPTIAQGRLRAAGNAPDRFEKEREEFFARVRDAYLQRVTAFPARFTVIDADAPIESIKKLLQETIAKLCF